MSEIARAFRHVASSWPDLPDSLGSVPDILMCVIVDRTLHLVWGIGSSKPLSRDGEPHTVEVVAGSCRNRATSHEKQKYWVPEYSCEVKSLSGLMLLCLSRPGPAFEALNADVSGLVSREVFCWAHYRYVRKDY